MGARLVGGTLALGIAVCLLFRQISTSGSDALQILSAYPANNAKNILPFMTVSIVFNNALDESRTTASFSMMTLSGTVVPGTVSYGPANTFLFAPGELYDQSQVLLRSTTYVMSFVGAADLHGNRLDATLLFTTNNEGARPATLEYHVPRSFTARWASSMQLFQPVCKAVFCQGPILSRNRLASDYPCPMAVVASSTWDGPNALRFNASEAVKPEIPSYFVFPYGGNNTWPCVDMNTGIPIPPTVMNFTLRPLRVVSVSPPSDAHGVSPDTVVTVQFSNDMDQRSVENGFSLLEFGTGRIPGSITWQGLTKLTFTPHVFLPRANAFLIVVDDARSIDNQDLPTFTSTFYTVEVTVPAVAAIWPPDGMYGVPPSLVINVTFSEPMNTTSVQTGFSLLVVGGGRGAGSFAWQQRNTVCMFAPAAALPRDRSFVVAILDAQSEAGVKMPDFSSSFHTMSAPPPPPARVLIAAPYYANYVDDVRTKLANTGSFASVEVFDLSRGTPSLGKLREYSAVLVFTTYNSLDSRMQFSSNLASYVDLGGKVVVMLLAQTDVSPIGPSWNSTYWVFHSADYRRYTRVTLGVVPQPRSPIMNNVNSLDGGPASFRADVTSVADGKVVAYWSDGTVLAALRFVGSTCRIDLNLFPPSSSVDQAFWVNTTDGATLMANSLQYIVGNCEQPLPPPPPPPPAGSVLIIASSGVDAYEADVQSKLRGTGRLAAVDIFDARQNTPSLNQLRQYGAVLFFGGQPPRDPEAFGTNLASYVQIGGKVVVMLFGTGLIPMGGAWNSSYWVIHADDYGTNVRVILGAVPQPPSPIMHNVRTLDGGSRSQHAMATSVADGTVVAYWSDRTVLAAQRFVGSTCRIDINLFPPSNSVRNDYWVNTTDGATLMANALEYIMRNCAATYEQAARRVAIKVW